MPFSHHSHSGQFCGHAVNTLEEVIQNAISKGMHTFCLTEHTPRITADFYPEEQEKHTETSLSELFDDYIIEARRLQQKYADQITIFVGFEGEWIRDSSPILLRALMVKHRFDLFIGSVHHVHTIPIDYDNEMYHRARQIAGGSDEDIFADYFDAQLEMLEELRPPVVGHFDLIRLKSDDPERSFQQWPRIWSKIQRNLRFIAGYGGLLELNSASLRKGMSEPYPKAEICKEFLAMNGAFTLSDDSHGIEQVGLNFRRTLEKADEAGITMIHHLRNDNRDKTADRSCIGFPHVSWHAVPLQEVANGLKV